MKHIEKIKFWAGITLIFFAVLGGLIFYLESFEVIDPLFIYDTSSVWKAYDSSSMAPIFLGLCGIAGAMLLNNVKYSSTVSEN